MISYPPVKQMPRHTFLILLICLGFSPAWAAPAVPSSAQAPQAVPHRAIYEVDMVASRSGSQIIDIHGKMFYEWGVACDAWVTNHRFNLVYEYADSPGMRISSDFATYESKDNQAFSFSSRRARNGELYEDLRGHSTAKEAVFTSPDTLKFELPANIMFPTAHTLRMIEEIKKGSKFFSATVFDGSDEEGPIEINTVIGGKVNPMKSLKPSDRLDMSLLNTPAYKVRMAVFPLKSDEEESDYEMSLVFHENGIISDMTIDYDHFSVRQKLVALEKMDSSCGAAVKKSPLPKKTTKQE